MEWFFGLDEFSIQDRSRRAEPEADVLCPDVGQPEASQKR
jgi:hypothetical protein